MTYRGKAKGKLIELEDSLPFESGQSLRVTIEPIDELGLGIGPFIARIAKEPPHVPSEVVDEMEASIRNARLPVRSTGAFDVD